MVGSTSGHEDFKALVETDTSNQIWYWGSLRSHQTLGPTAAHVGHAYAGEAVC